MTKPDSTVRFKLSRWIYGGLFWGLVLFMAWLFIPRAVNPQGFDPAEMARVETRMWRAYYAKDYVDLTFSVWSVTRSQFGGSPWTGLRIAYDAAHAARVFQRSTSREEAGKALPALEAYYTLLQSQTGIPFDPKVAAELELEWWQLRREDATTEDITLVLARLYAMVNEKPVDVMLEPARLRVAAMEFRDSHRHTGMTDEDWAQLQDMLLASYQSLKSAIEARPVRA